MTFTNSDWILEADILDLNISDHLAVYARRKKPRLKVKKVTLLGRSYRRYVKEDFQRELVESDLERFYTAEDPNAAWQIIEDKLRGMLNTICPVRKFKVNEVREQWVTNELLEEIKDKDRLIQVARNSDAREDWKRARNRVGSLVVNAKAEYVKDQQNEFGEKSGKIVLLDEEENTKLTQEEVLDYINSFFGEVGPRLAEKLNDEWVFYGNREPGSCREFSTDYEQVLQQCKLISITKSSGFEDTAYPSV